jgi:hypothetical protein
MGNWASAHMTASTSSTQRVAMRLTRNPTAMAAIENRKKNAEPSRPNCSGSSFSSVMIGTPASPTTILSAKFTSMRRNRRNVILQAPLGAGGVVMIVPSLRFIVLLALLDRSIQCYPRPIRQCNQAF